MSIHTFLILQPLSPYNFEWLSGSWNHGRCAKDSIKFSCGQFKSILVTLIHTIRTASLYFVNFDVYLVLFWWEKNTCRISFALILWVLKIPCGVRVHFIWNWSSFTLIFFALISFALKSLCVNFLEQGSSWQCDKEIKQDARFNALLKVLRHV